MKKKFVVLTSILIVLLLLFSSCTPIWLEHHDDYVLYNYNIIFPKQSNGSIVKTQSNRDNYGRNIRTICYVEDYFAYPPYFMFTVMMHDDEEIAGLDNYFNPNNGIIFDVDYREKDEAQFAQFLEDNNWGKPQTSIKDYINGAFLQSKEVKDKTISKKLNRTHSVLNEKIRPFYEQFASEKFDLTGDCPNVMQDKFGRTMGGILVYEENEWFLYAICFQGYFDDNIAYYDPETVFTEIDLDDYLNELQAFKDLNSWNETTTYDEIIALTSYSFNN